MQRDTSSWKLLPMAVGILLSFPLIVYIVDAFRGISIETPHDILAGGARLIFHKISLLPVSRNWNPRALVHLA